MGVARRCSTRARCSIGSRARPSRLNGTGHGRSRDRRSAISEIIQTARVFRYFGHPEPKVLFFHYSSLEQPVRTITSAKPSHLSTIATFKTSHFRPKKISASLSSRHGSKCTAAFIGTRSLFVTANTAIAKALRPGHGLCRPPWHGILARSHGHCTKLPLDEPINLFCVHLN